MSGRFPGEVSSVEFLEGTVDVGNVECDASRDPIVNVDFGDGEHLGAKLVGRQAAEPVTLTNEGETLPAGRNGARRYALDADLDSGSHVRDVYISAQSDPCVHDTTAIVYDHVVGQ